MQRLHTVERLVVLLLGFPILGLATARPQSNEQRINNSTPNRAGVAPSDVTGSDACVACHADVTRKYASNPHFNLAQTHDARGITCETCHGPGKNHVQSGGDAAKILAFTGSGTREEDEVCLGCHAASHPEFKHTAHSEAGVGCVGCHSIHKFESKKTMLKQKETTLCETCHEDVKPDFERPSHHKVNEGAIACTDCHDPHGTDQQQSPSVVANQNQVCINCHHDVAGPFVYEHPPIRTEGCASCHTPHGSKNPHLLTKSNENDLCTQCHTAIPNYTEPGTKPFHDQKTPLKPCTSCHSSIHGSNASRFFFH